MFKRVMYLLLVIFASCSNPPPPGGKIKTESHSKQKVSAVKPEASLWTISSFAPRQSGTEGRKYVRYAADGNFSDTTQANHYLYAEVLIDKQNAGIFLHKLKKSNPVEKFTGHVQLKMTNSSGQELQMTSTRSWNSSGGILIERNNSDYSQFRIFLLQNKGTILVEVKDSGTTNYHFSINADSFRDSFTKL
jgi:hypothetical protein